MQIALTKKLADALELKLPPCDETIDPLFTWTANWTKVWDNRRTEDLLVLVNNATRFTVAIYQVKKKDLKNVAELMKAAIINTFRGMNINPEIIEDYMRLADEVTFVQNKSRQTASWVTKAGVESAFYIGNEYNGIAKMYSDTIGIPSNYLLVNYSSRGSESFYPYRAMIDKLIELTGKQAYKYRAYELLVTLDLQVYKAERRLIVPADLELSRLHKVLQSAFRWRNYHLYDFTIIDEKTGNLISRLVPFEEGLEYNQNAVLMAGHTLSEYFPEHKKMLYSYDMGDNWEHEIQLIRVIEDYDQESPYVLEANGQTPPEDVGGVEGFVSFREIMLNPKHPEYEQVRAWANFWTPELSGWQSHPRVIHL